MKQFMNAYPGLFYGIVIFALLVLAQIAQAVFAAPAFDPLAPGGWFESIDVMTAVAAWIAGWVVKLLTAIGKEALVTEGNRTRILSAGIAVLVAGVGGYLALGMFEGYGGFEGALRAAGMALWAFIQSNASAIYDRQVADATSSKTAESDAERAGRAKAKLL